MNNFFLTFSVFSTENTNYVPPCGPEKDPWWKDGDYRWDSEINLCYMYVAKSSIFPIRLCVGTGYNSAGLPRSCLPKKKPKHCPEKLFNYLGKKIKRECGAQ